MFLDPQSQKGMVDTITAMGLGAKSIAETVDAVNVTLTTYRRPPSNAKTVEPAPVSDAEKERLRLLGANNDRPIEVHVHLPYGDPEAAGLAVANRVAYELSPS
jgi:hypothetical protein